MKLSTRILSIIMAFAMIVSSMVVVASAENAESAAVIKVVPGELNEDGLLPVEIKIKNDDDHNFVHLSFNLGYDSDAFAIDSVVDAKAILNDEGASIAMHSDNLALNPYKLTWSDINGKLGEGLVFEEETLIATVYFKPLVALYAGDSYDFTVRYNVDEDDEDIVGVALNSVEFDIVNGTYEVDEETTVEIFTVIDEKSEVIDYVIELTEDENIDLNPKLISNVKGSEAWTRTWTSSNSNIARVSKAGGVVMPTGIEDGEVEITVTYYNEAGEVMASATVNVNVTFTEGFDPIEGGEVVPTIILKDMELMVGETAAIDAVIVPADAEVAYTSDNEAVTVDAATGELTAVSVGSATITVAIGETTATCTVTVVPAVAKIGDTKYKSVADALAAATSGQTVTMIADSEESGIIIQDGVMLDIAGCTLTADYVVGLNGSYMNGTPFATNGTGAGKLKVAKNAIVLPEEAFLYKEAKHNNQYRIPVWIPDNTDTVNGGYYTFMVSILMTNDTTYHGLFIDEETETISFQFRHNATSYVKNNFMKDGISDNALKVIIELEWTTSAGDASQKFVFNEGQVMTVNNTNGAFYGAKLPGYTKLGIDNTNLDTLRVTAKMVSDSGAASVGVTWDINTTNK